LEHDWFVDVCAVLRAHGWLGTSSAVGMHSAGCLQYIESIVWFGVGSLVDALRCSRDTALSTSLFYQSATLILLSIHLSNLLMLLNELYSIFENALGIEFFYTSG